MVSHSAGTLTSIVKDAVRFVRKTVIGGMDRFLKLPTRVQAVSMSTGAMAYVFATTAMPLTAALGMFPMSLAGYYITIRLAKAVWGMVA